MCALQHTHARIRTNPNSLVTLSMTLNKKSKHPFSEYDIVATGNESMHPISTSCHTYIQTTHTRAGATLDSLLVRPTDFFEDVMSVRRENSIIRVELFKKLLGELLCSVVQLHAAGIMHRDIKPENILVSAHDRLCPVKLIDLGRYTCCMYVSILVVCM